MARILLVEDDQFTRELYQNLLQEANYQVDVASDGEEGLSFAIEGGYDLILLDIMLPKLDGLSLLKKLQITLPKKANKKIVMLTVLDQKPFIESALKNGASGYLMKPTLSPNQILSEVKNFLT